MLKHRRLKVKTCLTVRWLPWPWRPLGLRSAAKTLPPRSVLPGTPCGEGSPLSGKINEQKKVTSGSLSNITGSEVSSCLWNPLRWRRWAKLLSAAGSSRCSGDPWRTPRAGVSGLTEVKKGREHHVWLVFFPRVFCTFPIVCLTTQRCGKRNQKKWKFPQIQNWIPLSFLLWLWCVWIKKKKTGGLRVGAAQVGFPVPFVTPQRSDFLGNKF